MKKRISKKLHKKYLNDVVWQISLSCLWRKRLFKSKNEKEFLINKDSADELPRYIAKTINRYNLCYVVYKQKNEENFEMERFIFVSNRYREVYGFSDNNPNVI